MFLYIQKHVREYCCFCSHPKWRRREEGRDFFWQIECKNKEIFKYHIWQLQEYSWPEKSKGFSEFIHEKLSEGIFAHHGLLCPCRAVFGNCYFWAIIDLPWCGRGTNKPLSWQVFILVKTAKISCVRLIAIAQEKTKHISGLLLTA